MDDKKSRVAGFIVRPRMVLVVLVATCVVLFLLHLALQFSKFNGGPDKLLFFSNLFNVGEESSISTWFSQLVLLSAALICGVVAYVKSKLKEKYVFQWILVGVAFLFLSIDEVAVIHEQLISALENNGVSGGTSWYIYAAIVVTVLGVLLVRFWWFLPRKTKWLLVLSAIVYLVGAVVLDVVGGKFVGQGFLHEGLIVGAEEFVEMIGASLFVYVLLDYAATTKHVVGIKLQA